jgi:Mor family transcriptional regulator
VSESEKKEVCEYPEILATIADHVSEYLTSEKGFSDQEAAKVGLGVSEAVRLAFGGEDVYIPKAISYECSKRDMEILEMFNGSNFREVCRKFKISRRRIHQIIFATKNGKQLFMDF